MEQQIHSVSNRLSAIAPAKVNLTLRVLGKRTDGYHDIESLAIKVTLYDGIDLDFGIDPSIKIECTDPSLPTGDQNLIWKAVEALAREACVPAAVAIKLHKVIPVGAGLGGGSSNAATTLMRLNTHWKANLDVSRLKALASELGSDVPQFLVPSSTVLRGRGERVDPVDLSWRGWLVLIFPPFGVSTPRVYQHWRDSARQQQCPPLSAVLTCRSARDLDALLFNGLQESIYHCEPRMDTIKQAIERRIDQSVHITGSGSTLFVCVDSHEEAQHVNEKIRLEQVRTQIVRVLTKDDNK